MTFNSVCDNQISDWDNPHFSILGNTFNGKALLQEELVLDTCLKTKLPRVPRFLKFSRKVIW